jgi:hypothetical protein
MSDVLWWWSLFVISDFIKEGLLYTRVLSYLGIHNLGWFDRFFVIERETL